MLSNLKEMKKTFGFMEYFFAGYLFANGVSDTNYIKVHHITNKIFYFNWYKISFTNYDIVNFTRLKTVVPKDEAIF